MNTTPAPVLADLLAHTRWVEDLARSLVRDPDAAGDLAQATLLAALEQRDPPRRNLRGWLASVLRNQARERGRRESLRRDVERRGARVEELPGADEIVERAECERRTVEAVLALEEPHRTTLLLRYFEGLPPEAIAQRSAVPLATVTSRITRAHARLREKLSSERHDANWAAVIAPIVLRAHPAAATALASARIGTIVMISAAKTVAALLVVALLAWLSWPARPPQSPVTAVAPPSRAESPPAGAPPDTESLAANPKRALVEVAPALPEARAAAEPASSDPPRANTEPVGGRIFGRVFRPDGQLASRRKIRIALMNAAVDKSTVTDDRGAFDERGLDPGTWALSTWPDEPELDLLGKKNTDTLKGMTYMTQCTVDLQRGAEVEVTLGKPPEHGVRVHGRMLLGGTPAEGYMTWLPDGRDAMDRQRLATASAKDGYEVLLDGPGRHLLVAIQFEMRAEFVVDVPDTAEFEHDIALPDAALHGHVVTADRRPVAGASVELVPRAGHNPRHPSANITYTRHTDSEGKFSFRCLPHARYSVSTHGGWIGPKKDDVRAGAMELRDVDLRTGTGATDVDLVVATGIIVTGRVHAESMRVGGTGVFVFGEDGEALDPLEGVNADKDGKFELFALAAGRYFAIGANGLSWSDVVRFEVPASGESSPLRLELKPASTLIVDMRGREPAWIDVRDENNCCLSAVFDTHVFNRAVNRDWSSTLFTYRLPAGNYAVNVLGAVDAASARVSALAEQTHTIDMRRR